MLIALQPPSSFASSSSSTWQLPSLSTATNDLTLFFTPIKLVHDVHKLILCHTLCRAPPASSDRPLDAPRGRSIESQLTDQPMQSFTLQLIPGALAVVKWHLYDCNLSENKSTTRGVLRPSPSLSLFPPISPRGPR